MLEEERLLLFRNKKCSKFGKLELKETYIKPAHFASRIEIWWVDPLATLRELE